MKLLFGVLDFLDTETRTLHFVVDSSYVLNIVTDRCPPKHNVLLTTIMKYLWDQVKLKHKVTIAWVKSHSGVLGNERADAAEKKISDIEEDI